MSNYFKTSHNADIPELRGSHFTVQFYAEIYNEETWQEYYANFKRHNEPVIKELKQFVTLVPEEILVPIGVIIGSAASVWLNKELDEIPGYTPLKLLQTKDGIAALKVIIMRLPC